MHSDPMSGVLTLGGAMVNKGGTLHLSGVYSAAYDRVSIFVRATAPEAKPARFTVNVNDAAGRLSIPPITLDAHSYGIVGAAVDIDKLADFDIALAVEANVDLEQLEVKIGLYRRGILSDLADRFSSDKGSVTAHSMIYGAHGYAEVYDRIFMPLRQRPTAILEVGLHTPSVHTGSPTDAPSLRMWLEYFPRARVVGFDRNDFAAVAIRGASILRGDQSNRTDLLVAASACTDGYDIIIDDGSHQSSHQQISLAALFPALISGGIYVIEDLSWQPDPTENPKTIDVLRRWGKTGVLESPFMTDQERQFLMQHVASIEIETPFNCELAVLRRR